MTTATTTPAAAPTTATTPAPLAPTKRPDPWGARFVEKLLGPPSSSTTPVEEKAAAPLAQAMTYGEAAKHAVGDAVTVGITGSLLGAANAKGLLDFGRVAVDGLLALFGFAVSVAAAPHSPVISRTASRVAMTGLATYSFRRGDQAVRGTKPTLAGEAADVETRAAPGRVDPIAKCAEELGL